jgi:lipopolysaccharide export system permease protein
MLVLAVPIGVLFATLLAFGGMAASHEITIIKASGGSLWKMMFPVIISGAILTLLLFWFNDEILPEANHKAKVLMMDINRKKPTFSIEAGQFSTAIEGYTILARSVDSITGLLKGVTVYDNTRGRNINIVSADTGRVVFSGDYSKLFITLYNGETHQLISGFVQNYKKILFKKYQIAVDAQGFNFSRSDINSISRGDREMHIRDMQVIVNQATLQEKNANDRIQKVFAQHLNFLKGKFDNTDKLHNPGSKLHSEESHINEFNAGRTLNPGLKATIDTSIRTSLQNVVNRLNFMRSSISSDISQAEDYNIRAESYIVEIQKKYAIPFACLMFVFVGCPFGIITKGGNFGFSAAITLGFYVFYWACLIGGEKLADRDMMSPVLSMWLGNIILGVVGLFLTIRINNETLKLPGKMYFFRIKEFFTKLFIKK